MKPYLYTYGKDNLRKGNFAGGQAFLLGVAEWVYPRSEVVNLTILVCFYLRRSMITITDRESMNRRSIIIRSTVHGV